MSSMLSEFSGMPNKLFINKGSILNLLLNLKVFDNDVLFGLRGSYSGTGGSWSKFKINFESSLLLILL